MIYNPKESLLKETTFKKSRIGLENGLYLYILNEDNSLKTKGKFIVERRK